MAADYDVVIVGSGFGGAVCAYRLARAGATVLVLERGRRWNPQTFPRRPEDPWLWDNQRPVARHGWFDFRVFKNMTVVQGAGVGGGSLVYANISVNAREETFQAGWPPHITYQTLQERYAAVGTMLGVEPVPTNQWPERTKLVREAADRAGYGNKFRRLDLAVRFDRNWSYNLPDPHNPAHAVVEPNAFGIGQGTCVHLGNCVIGCDVNARNSLDLNYLAGAERLYGAVVRPLHIVRYVSPSPDGYEVHFEEIANGRLEPGEVSGRTVILSAGSLGSTEILLRSRREGLLPNVSGMLGRGWSSNGDFLTPGAALLPPSSREPHTRTDDYRGDRPARRRVQRARHLH
jgi:cholesterol oxidase